MLQGFDEWLLRGAEEALGEDESVCIECGNALDKFSLDGGYEQCEPCSIVDVNNYFETLEAGEV